MVSNWKAKMLKTETRTKWGAKRLIDAHKFAIWQNKRISQYIRERKKDLVEGKLSPTAKEFKMHLKTLRTAPVVTALGFGLAAAASYAEPSLAEKSAWLSALAKTAYGAGALTLFGGSVMTLGAAERIELGARKIHEPIYAEIALERPPGVDSETHAKVIDERLQALQAENKLHQFYIDALKSHLEQRENKKQARQRKAND